ncbi:nuclear transport factor 2 family protein [Rhodococcus sp. X156]|uniref:nuclear transport factor 2 family protein n=1 Tax=Rhodococcus sp. X156 TaxID=2499145 RepID=UPI000FDC3CF1|nr:nuclear transport factor 2 family protein [Rhodococcus sp. X156]
MTVTQLEQLVQVERIKKLKHDYWRACDAKDPKGFRSCFTRTGSSIDYGTLGATDADGMAAVFERIALAQDGGGHRVLDMHHGFHPDVTIVGPAEATGRWTLQFRQVDLHARTETVLSGEYDDHYVIEDGDWKMDRCHFTRGWSITRPLTDDTVVEQP